MTEIMDNGRTEGLTLADFISAQCTDADCHSAFASVKKLTTSSNVESYGVLVQVSHSVGASKRVVAAT